MPFTEDTANNEIIEQYGLPELPEPVGDTDDYAEGELAELVIFRQHAENIYLDGFVTLADAQEYCSRDDTGDAGGGWFTGFYRR
jgi:hypothetical protein